MAEGMDWVDFIKRFGKFFGGDIEVIRTNEAGLMSEVIRGEIVAMRTDRTKCYFIVQHAISCAVNTGGMRTTWKKNPIKEFAIDMSVCKPKEKEVDIIELQAGDFGVVNVYRKGGPPLYSASLKEIPAKGD